MTRFLILIILLSSLDSFGKTIYEEYQTTAQYADFDHVMNQVRFPSSDRETMRVYVEELEDAIEKFPDYPELSSAYYFMGWHNFKLKKYRTSVNNFAQSKELKPSLVDKTPINRYISRMGDVIRRQNSILLSSGVILVWLVLIGALLLHGIKKKALTKKALGGVFAGVVLGVITVAGWFSIDTSASADGFEGLYVAPTLVRSTLFQLGATPLIILAIYALFASIITSIATFAATVFPKLRILFSLATALIVGSSLSVLYYQYYGLNADRTGTGTFKRMSYPEAPIDLHKDVPDEMIKMYDEKVQTLIKTAKTKARIDAEEKASE